MIFLNLPVAELHSSFAEFVAQRKENRVVAIVTADFRIAIDE